MLWLKLNYVSKGVTVGRRETFIRLPYASRPISDECHVPWKVCIGLALLKGDTHTSFKTCWPSYICKCISQLLSFSKQITLARSYCPGRGIVEVKKYIWLGVIRVRNCIDCLTGHIRYNKTDVERRQTLGHPRSINPNMINHVPQQSPLIF